MSTSPVIILDKDTPTGEWVRHQLLQVGIDAQSVSTVSDLLAETDVRLPIVCLVAVRPPVAQVLSLVRELTQEPRFSYTAFILMGWPQHKHAAFEAGADDYLVTPPDVIELRKRVRLYLGRAELEARVVAETRITQELDAFSQGPSPSEDAELIPDPEPVTLLEHAAVLSQERDLFETILRHAGEAVALVGVDGTLLYANPAWENLFGYLPDTSTGIQIEWPPSSDDPRTAEEIAEAVGQGVSWKGDIRYTLPTGRRLDVALTLTPVRDAVHDLLGYVSVQTDISERKADENLTKQFLTDAAVEMRTPVTNIKMREYLLREAPPDQHALHVQALERETERLSRMVEDVLELSRFDAGLVLLNRQEADMARLVSEAVTRFSPMAEEKGVVLAVTPSGPLPRILVDATQVARALGILIDNAVRYTPQDGHVDVRLGQEAWTGGDYLTVQVEDTGPGIAPEALPLIFDRFYRTEHARDSGVPGVGLGLSIAQEIVSLHDGHITVESELGQLSRFTIWLPVQ
jgi:two-component system phosphate regulon sensor histidine kinase PhoR